jgi:hypothetical protein
MPRNSIGLARYHSAEKSQNQGGSGRIMAGKGLHLKGMYVI